MILNRRPDYASTLQALPAGRRGTLATLVVMARVAREAKVDPMIRRLAVDIVSAWPEKDTLAEAEALQCWVRDNIRYTGDVDGIETVQTPAVTLDSAAGDCDDKATLLAALLATIGHRPELVAVGPNNQEFSHVLVEDIIGPLRVALETTEQVAAGWYPPDLPARLVMPV